MYAGQKNRISGRYNRNIKILDEEVKFLKVVILQVLRFIVFFFIPKFSVQVLYLFVGQGIVHGDGGKRGKIIKDLQIRLSKGTAEESGQ